MKAYRTEQLYTEKDILLNHFIKLKLPDGCIGMQLVFKTKKALRAFDRKAGINEVGVETNPVRGEQ